MSRNQLPTLCIMPVKGLLRDLPLAVPLEQGENLGNAGIRSGQLSRPAMDFEVQDGDGFEDLNAREPWMDIRCRAILFDPIEQVLDRSRTMAEHGRVGDEAQRFLPELQPQAH